MPTLRVLPIAALLMLVGGSVHADVLRMPHAEPANPTVGTHPPQRGMSMAEVVRRFGQPEKKYPAVGGHTPRHPPITRWDYPRYSVFFERSTVLDTVVPGHPPRLYHANQLETAR